MFSNTDKMYILYGSFIDTPKEYRYIKVYGEKSYEVHFNNTKLF